MIADIFWVLLSTIKFPFTLFISAIMENSIIMTLESFLGSIIAILLFTFSGVAIKKWVLSWWPYKTRRFNRFNRFLVRTRQRYGVWGVAFFTPIILGFPIGIILSLGMTTHRHHILKPMIVSTLLHVLFAFLIGCII